MTINCSTCQKEKCSEAAVLSLACLEQEGKYCHGHTDNPTTPAADPMPHNTEQTEVAALIRDLTQAHAEQGFLAKSDVRDRLTALVANARTQALREAVGAASSVELVFDEGESGEACDGQKQDIVAAIRSLLNE